MTLTQFGGSTKLWNAPPLAHGTVEVVTNAEGHTNNTPERGQYLLKCERLYHTSLIT